MYGYKWNAKWLQIKYWSGSHVKSEKKTRLSGEGGPDWNYQWPKPGPNTRLLKKGDSIYGRQHPSWGHPHAGTLKHLITDLGGGADQPIALASGDFVFVGDVGRPDLLESAAGKKGAMEPAARQLQESLYNRLTPFADFLQILPGHGAGSAWGKALGAVPTTTLGYERRFNGALKLALNDPEVFIKDILAGQSEPPLYFATMKRVNRYGLQWRKPYDRRRTSMPRYSQERPRTLARGFLMHAPTASLLMRAFPPCDPRSAKVFFLFDLCRFLPRSEWLDSTRLGERQRCRLCRPATLPHRIDKIVGWITTAEAQENGLFTARLERVNLPEFNSAKAVVQGEIIDVRTTAEFQSGHLEGARSFPYTRLKAPGWTTEGPTPFRSLRFG
jgi:hydroxyacylglutathione hydrolase